MALLDSLASHSIPNSFSSLLQSSVQLGKSKTTHKQVLSDARLREQLKALSKPSKNVKKKDDNTLSLDDISSLLGTSWGMKNKKRRRRLLKIEKVMSYPRTQCQPQESGVEEEEEECVEGDFGEDEGELTLHGECRAPGYELS